MGLLKHLLFWPVTGPEFLVKFSLDKVEGAVREQLTDDQSVKEDLMALQMRLELGEIDDEQYVAEEAGLMERLREVRRWREEFGMGVSGGPVRVRSEREETVEPDDSADVVDEDEARAARAEDEVEAGKDERAPRVADPGAGADIELNLDWD